MIKTSLVGGGKAVNCTSVQETFCGIHDRIGGLWLKTEAQNLEGV